MSTTSQLTTNIQLTPSQVRIGVRKTDCYCSFLSEPHARFRVRNIVGDDGSSSVSQVRPGPTWPDPTRPDRTDVFDQPTPLTNTDAMQRTPTNVP